MAKSDRGQYAKGKRMRKQILDAALNIVAVEGFNQTTLAKISHAVGLTEAGVLHYFSSVDDLLVQVLKQRDMKDIAASTESLPDLIAQMQELANNPEHFIAEILSVVSKNTNTPGLVELYANMSVKAADPKSSAHAYFAFRGTVERTIVGHTVKKVFHKQHRTTSIPVEDVARLMQALIDGLQFEWLQNDDVIMNDLAAKAMAALVDTEEAHRQ